MKPVVDRLQGDYVNRVDFLVYADVNSDAEASEFANRQQVSAIPTMMLVSADGTEIARWVGSQSEVSLRQALDGVTSE